MMKLTIALPLFAALFAAQFPAGAQTASSAEMKPIRIQFAGRLGGKPFACGTQYEGVGTDNVTITPSDLRFYLSDVQLLGSDGEATPLTLDQDGTWQYQNVALVDLEDGTGGCRNGNPALHTEVTGAAPAREYVGVRVTIGVPFALDHQDSATAPPPFNFTAMNWVWQSGFKFIRAEVIAEAKGELKPMALQRRGVSSGFPVHIGSTRCVATSLTSAPQEECKHPNRVNVTLAVFHPAKDVVIFDMDRLLAGANLAQNAENTAPGCMSGENDPDCRSIFQALGLPFNGAAREAQTVLYGEAKQ
jgi:uncharacterized repeat protein (TIGR04052 family)